MKVVPFRREYAWPEPGSLISIDPDVPADLSRLHMLYQAVYDAEELQQLAEMSFVLPRQVAAS